MSDLRGPFGALLLPNSGSVCTEIGINIKLKLESLTNIDLFNWNTYPRVVT
jgi:hypothetical protein